MDLARCDITHLMQRNLLPTQKREQILLIRKKNLGPSDSSAPGLHIRDDPGPENPLVVLGYFLSHPPSALIDARKNEQTKHVTLDKKMPTQNMEMEGYPMWSGCDQSVPAQMRWHVVMATNRTL